MRRSLIAVLTALVSLSLLLTACGGSGPTPTPTTEPSPTPAPMQSFTSEDGKLTLSYPEGWTVTEDMGIIYVLTSMEASSRLVTFGSLQPGQVYIQIGRNSILSGAADDPVVHLPESLRLLAEGTGLTLSEATALTVGDMPAARTEAANDKLALLGISLKASDELFLDVIAYTAPEELAQFEPTIMSIVESIAYSAE